METYTIKQVLEAIRKESGIIVDRFSPVYCRDSVIYPNTLLNMEERLNNSLKPRTWICRNCQEVNSWLDEVCSKCLEEDCSQGK